MKLAIAGVVPAESSEVAVMTIWPSIGAFSMGRLLGRLYSVRWPGVFVLRLGHLFALLSIPLALLLYFGRMLPGSGRRYTLTNRRIVIQTPITGVDLDAIGLDSFDAIEIETLPGQAWFAAGNLSFRREGSEVFRLDGVAWPDAFRQTCLKSRQAYVGVASAVQSRTAKGITGGFSM